MHRRIYLAYTDYLNHQMEKTRDPMVASGCARKRGRRMKAFRESFKLIELSAGQRGICLGARFGEEMQVLRDMGFTDTIGVDLVPSLPLVVAGDFHHLPFADDSFDFAFSNALDHTYSLRLFAEEVSRVVRATGLALWHVALKHMADHESLLIDSIDEVIVAMQGWQFVRKDSVPYESHRLTALLFTRGM